MTLAIDLETEDEAALDRVWAARVTAKQATQLIDVPDVRQRNNFECGAAAVTSVLRHFGVEITLANAARRLGTNEDRFTSPQAIIGLLHGLGLNAEPRFNMSLDDLRDKLTLVPMQACGGRKSEDEKCGHWVVVLGVDDGGVVIEDPTIGVTGIDADDFVEAWHDVGFDGIEYVRFGIAVSGLMANSNPEGHNQYTGAAVKAKSPTKIIEQTNPDWGTRIRLTVKHGDGKESHLSMIPYDDHLRVVSSFVQEKFRGQGVGKALYAEAIAIAKREGKTFLTSDSSVTDDAARMWKAMGAKELPNGTEHGERFRLRVENFNPKGHNQYSDNPAPPPFPYKMLSAAFKLKYKPWFDKHGQDARPDGDGQPIPGTSKLAAPAAPKPASTEAKTQDGFAPLEIDSTSDAGWGRSGRGLPKLPTAAEAKPKPGDVDAILRHVRGTGINYATIGEVMESTGFSHARTAHALAPLYHDRKITLKQLEGLDGMDPRDKAGQVSQAGERLGAVSIRGNG